MIVGAANKELVGVSRWRVKSGSMRNELENLRTSNIPSHDLALLLGGQITIEKGQKTREGISKSVVTCYPRGY